MYSQGEHVDITITSGTGEGPTSVAAFDAALHAAGVLNYNLLHLSSVIPPRSTVARRTYTAPVDEYGHRLYVVMARRDENREGVAAWSSLGWVQEPGDNRGLFVECTETTEVAVRRDIEATLLSMMESRHRDYGPIDMETAGIRCRNSARPVCALVIGVYQSQGWQK